MVSNQSTARNRGWSPELLTVLGAMLAIGVGLAGLILNVQAQAREDMHGMETRIREDMAAMEKRIREDMSAMEAGIRRDMAAMEAGIRRDMAAMEAGIRKDMGTMEGRIREDVRELRGDVGELRERVAHLGGRFDGGGFPAAQFEEAPRPTSPGW